MEYLPTKQQLKKCNIMTIQKEKTETQLQSYNRLSAALSVHLLQYHRRPDSRVWHTIETTVRTIKALSPSAWTRGAVELLCTQTFGSLSAEFATLITNRLLTI